MSAKHIQMVAFAPTEEAALEYRVGMLLKCNAAPAGMSTYEMRVDRVWSEVVFREDYLWDCWLQSGDEVTVDGEEFVVIEFFWSPGAARVKVRLFCPATKTNTEMHAEYVMKQAIL